MGLKGTASTRFRHKAFPSRQNNESGQVAILFALVFTFMFVLFAFVVDMGHLINNKMNLQLAADTAAYAGAAWQARIMNRMGQKNYHLRQIVKEMSMRVNVTHIRENRDFPRGFGFINGGNQASATNELFVCQQAHGYTAISGLQYAQDTNLCRNASPSTGGLPPIVVPPVIATFDPLAHAIAAQIRRIQQAANQECRAAANDNRILVQYLIDQFSRRSQFHARQMLELEQFLNSVGQDEEATESSRHPLLRSVYETVNRNLSLSNAEDFKIEILHPSGRRYIELEQENMFGTMFFINFTVAGNGCLGNANFINFNNVVAGFSKVPNVVTFFGLKLTSKPRMLFMPAAWVEAAFPELTAVALAKPFGSRIGPKLFELDQLLPTPNRAGNISRLVNFSVRPDDNLGMLNSKLMAYYDALHPFNGIGRPQGNRAAGWPESRVGGPGRDALRAIRAPTIFDSIFYTVFPDPGPNLSTDYLEPEFAQALYPDYLEAADYVNDTVIQTPQPRTPAYFPGGVGSRNRGNGWIQVNAGPTGVGGPYAGYADETPSAHSVTSAIGLPLINGPEKAVEFGFATPEMIHSAWAPEGKPGRIGYGVKIVSFDTLVNRLRVRQGRTQTLGPISNPPTGDPAVQQTLH